MSEATRASWWKLYDDWTLERVRAFDQAIDEFEAAWRWGDGPSPAAFRDRAIAEEWPFWLAEMLAVEMTARRSRGEELSEDELVKRFSDDASTVRQAFAETFATPEPPPTPLPLPSPVEGEKHLFRAGESLDGRYVIERFVQAGGMGELFQGRRVSDDRKLAFKALDLRRSEGVSAAYLNQRRAALARFLREMKVLAELRHPHLVTATEFLQLPQRAPLIVMDWVEGKDLHTLVRDRGPLPASDACEIIRQAADGLAYAWKKYKLVHRDIKPSNLMLSSDGETKVVDFGLVRAELPSAGDREEYPTKSNIRLGTADFMAPEQWDDPRDVTSAADVYSLGMTLFFLLTQKIAFAVDQPSPPVPQLRQAHAVLAPPDVRKWRPEVALGLKRLIDRMLAKEPDNRPSMGDVAAELAAWPIGTDLAQRAADVTAPEATAASSLFWTRRRLLTAAGCICGSGTLAGLAIAFRPYYLPPPKVFEMSVTVYENELAGSALRTLGQIGQNVFSVDIERGTDRQVAVGLNVRFDVPAYFQLMAANPDGRIELLAASDKGGREGDPAPGRVASVAFPSSGSIWRLDLVRGLQAFALVASRRKLPPFDKWSTTARLEQLWAPADGLSYVWKSTGGAIQPVFRADESPRGQLEQIVPNSLLRFWKAIRGALPAHGRPVFIAFPVV